MFLKKRQDSESVGALFQNIDETKKVCNTCKRRVVLFGNHNGLVS